MEPLLISEGELPAEEKTQDTTWTWSHWAVAFRRDVYLVFYPFLIAVIVILGYALLWWIEHLLFSGSMMARNICIVTVVGLVWLSAIYKLYNTYDRHPLFRYTGTTGPVPDDLLAGWRRAELGTMKCWNCESNRSKKGGKCCCDVSGHPHVSWRISYKGISFRTDFLCSIHVLLLGGFTIFGLILFNMIMHLAADTTHLTHDIPRLVIIGCLWLYMMCAYGWLSRYHPLVRYSGTSGTVPDDLALEWHIIELLTDTCWTCYYARRFE